MTKSDIFRLSILAGACAVLAGAWVVRAHAEEGDDSTGPWKPHDCMAVEKMKALAESHDAKWIELTHDQWSFLRTISAISPATPKGFPYGDKAALARNGDKSIVVFIDGSRACDVMPVTQELVTMLNSVEEITHEPPQGVNQ
jgi:hypothetical protein